MVSIKMDYRKTGFERLNIKKKFTALSSYLNRKILKSSEFNAGALNKVLKLKIVGGTAVLKISPLYFKDSLAREVWSMNKILKNTKIKISSILHYSSAKNPIFPGHELLLMEYIPGRLLNRRDFNSRKINKRIKKIYDSFHKIPIKGFGWLNEKFEGRYESWKNFLLNIDNIELTLKKKAISEEEYKWILHQLANSQIGRTFKPILLHGDFKWSNFIVNKKKITPIDFQNCYGGDPFYEWGIGLFFIPQLFKNLNIYLKEDFNPKNKKIIILYAMRHAISTMGHRACIGNKEELKEAVDRYKNLKKLYLSIGDIKNGNGYCGDTRSL